ncbi:MAG: hypothetical protein AAF648_09270 [Pseudomonadota bacterium]
MTTPSQPACASYAAMRMYSLFLSLVLGLTLTGCGNGPLGPIPGGALAGPTARFDPATLPPDPSVIVLETNPAEPYSVKINAVTVEGQLYIDPTAERTWYKHISNNGEVRFRFDGTKVIYPAIAVPVTDPSITRRFEADRIVLRLDPR